MNERGDERRVDVGGVRLAVREQGRGPTVLLINGTAPALWGSLPERLAATHRVIDYDRRSFAASPAPPPKGTRRHTDDAAALLRRLDAGPALLVGWSMGAVIAAELACLHPELVSGLVLLEPPFRAKQHPRPAMLAAIGGATLLGRFGRASSGAERFLRWALQRRDGSSAYVDAGQEWQADVRRDGPSIVSEVSAGEQLDRDALRAIAVPTSVLTGEQSDPVFSDAARRIADLIPRSELVTVPGSSHALPFDATPAVADAAMRMVAAELN
ncbi:alpha/beta fold hydrolase [Rathayibacter sp. CAU 1779]